MCLSYSRELKKLACKHNDLVLLGFIQIIGTVSKSTLGYCSARTSLETNRKEIHATLNMMTNQPSPRERVKYYYEVIAA